LKTSLFLNPDFAIFKYHFPDKKLLPGGLLIDICRHLFVRDETCRKAFTCSFNAPCLPGEEIEMQDELVKGKQKIKAMSRTALKAGITIHTVEPFANHAGQQPPDAQRISNRQFSFFHTKEITFLDSYSLLNSNHNTVSAAGKYMPQEHNADFLGNFCTDDHFGSYFELIEFMGLTGMAANNAARLIDTSELYGFLKIEGFQIIKQPTRTKELTCLIYSEINDHTLSWQGFVFCGNEMTAKVDNVISVPLRRKNNG
jgi:hypothetical protein